MPYTPTTPKEGGDVNIDYDHLESTCSIRGRLEIVAGSWGSGEGEERLARGGEHTRIETWGRRKTRWPRCYLRRREE